MQFEYPSNATVLVTGSRTYQDSERIRWELERLELRAGHLVAGCATGADALALAWARTLRVPFRSWIRYEAQWTAHGRAAGPKRNRLMVDAEKPHVVLAFFDGMITRGTLHCLTYAMSRGARPRIVGLPLTLLSG